MNDSFKGRADNEIVFSRSVKAGKRIYYIDVKQDRNSELYLSITESKRIKDGDEESRPVFEKHKIFLYREDLNKFLTALQAAADYAQERAVPSPTTTVTTTISSWTDSCRQDRARLSFARRSATMILPARFLKISNWIWISNLSNVESGAEVFCLFGAGRFCPINL